MNDDMLKPRDVPCAHCKGTGTITLPPEIATLEAYYYGCRWDKGHYWFDRRKRDWDIEKIVGQNVSRRIDGGFCPGRVEGNIYKRTRDEVEGEASLNHVDGWTILSFWDRSVDPRGACNSNFVARGTWDYTTMRAIAEAQYPDIWDRYKFEIRLVEQPEGTKT